MNIILLPLGKGLFATVDSDCGEDIWSQKWSANKKPDGKIYAYRASKVGEERSRKTHIMLHAQITGTHFKTESDHKSGDSLDNRRSNLRRCSHAENGRNLAKWSSPTSSKFKGVCLRPNGKWTANLVVLGKQIYLGVFSDEESAARAYDVEALIQHGTFARLNFPL